jgi:hypothetical protein
MALVDSRDSAGTISLRLPWHRVAASTERRCVTYSGDRSMPPTPSDDHVVTSAHTDDWDFDTILDLMYYVGNRHRVYRTLWICACGFERRREMWEDHMARGSVSEGQARNMEWAAFIRHKYGDNFVIDESAQLELLSAETFRKDLSSRRTATLDWWIIASIIIAWTIYTIFALAMR